jgi:hypothetical protein
LEKQRNPKKRNQRKDQIILGIIGTEIVIATIEDDRIIGEVMIGLMKILTVPAAKSQIQVLMPRDPRVATTDEIKMLSPKTLL